MNKRENTTPEQEHGDERRGARQPVERDGGATVLHADDIVSNAVAKRDASERRADEQMAEGGGLATGIGDDRVGGRANDDSGKE